MEMPKHKLRVQCLHLRTHHPVQTHTVLHVQVVAAFVKRILKGLRTALQSPNNFTVASL